MTACPTFKIELKVENRKCGNCSSSEEEEEKEAEEEAEEEDVFRFILTLNT